MKKLFLLVTLCFLAVSVASAAKIDTVAVYSPSMAREIPCLVITPDDISSAELPTIYFLHGCGGSYVSWANKANFDTEQLVDDYKFIAVLPDGNTNSW